MIRVATTPDHVRVVVAIQAITSQESLCIYCKNLLLLLLLLLLLMLLPLLLLPLPLQTCSASGVSSTSWLIVVPLL